jgi:glycosyltransferase involved in cell wall biosynthesis
MCRVPLKGLYMRDDVLVSVVMPFYNADAYIYSSAMSLITQTYGNIEFIFVNDKSTDQSVQVLSKLLSDYNCIRYMVVTSLGDGLVDALNLGISMANGIWVARMDADDIALPYRIELQMSYAKNNSLDVCGSGVTFFKGWRSFPFIYPEYHDSISYCLSEIKINCIAHPTVIFKKDRVPQYNKQYRHAEDYCLWVNCIEQGLKLGNVPKVLLKYRVHDAQITTTKRFEQKELVKELGGNLRNFLNFGGFKPKLRWSDRLIIDSIVRWNQSINYRESVILHFTYKLQSLLENRFALIVRLFSW